jgi:hypothetical protein
MLAGRPNRNGYPQVTLHRDGKKVCIRVHTIVCSIFHGPKPKWARGVAHFDGGRTNNNAENLRWATGKENSADMVRHGTRLKKDKHPRALLTSEQVAEIRRIYAENKSGVYVKRGTRAALALRFGVGVHVIKDIILNRCWTDDPPAAVETLPLFRDRAA